MLPRNVSSRAQNLSKGPNEFELLTEAGRHTVRNHFEGTHMADPIDALVLDLLEWIGPRARPYGEVIDGWRPSCPGLTVWEDANALGYITHERSEGRGGALISVSALGRAALFEHRRI